MIKLIKKIFGDQNSEVSFEPGRYLVAKSGLLITKILTTKTSGSVNYLITDAGMQTFLRPALYNDFHNIISLTKNKIKKQYTIAGPICESTDILAKNIILPEQKSGNYLAICDTGAYGAVMSSNYNTNVLPAEIMVNANLYSIIRERQNISDLINNDIIPDWLKL